METQEPGSPNPGKTSEQQASNAVIEGEFKVLEERSSQDQSHQNAPTSKTTERKIKVEFEGPDDIVQRLIFGRPLIPKDKSAQSEELPSTNQESLGKSTGKRKVEFEGPEIMVQRLVFGRPLVEPPLSSKKETEDTAKEEFTAHEMQPQPEPEPEPTAVPVPVNQEVVQVDHEKAKRFYEQLGQASKNIDDQANVLNLQAIKGLEGFKDVDTTIQELASEYSREDFDLQAHHLLALQEISEKLTTELEEKNGWDKTVHQNNVSAVGLTLNIEITNRASQIKGQVNH